MGAAVESYVTIVASVVWRSTSVWLARSPGPFRCRCSFPLPLLTDTLGYARNLLGRALSGLLCSDFQYLSMLTV